VLHGGCSIVTTSLRHYGGFREDGMVKVNGEESNATDEWRTTPGESESVEKREAGGGREEKGRWYQGAETGW
jgi:hypothetical protein